MNICILCKREVKNSDNAKRKRCPSCNTRIRRYRIKARLVQLFGGKCNRCGWDKHLAGFEFHHKDPTQKEFGLGKAFTTNWEKAKQEASKCELLCSCCHKEEHAGYLDTAFVKVASEYQGRILNQ